MIEKVNINALVGRYNMAPTIVLYYIPLATAKAGLFLNLVRVRGCRQVVRKFQLTTPEARPFLAYWKLDP